MEMEHPSATEVFAILQAMRSCYGAGLTQDTFQMDVPLNKAWCKPGSAAGEDVREGLENWLGIGFPVKEFEALPKDATLGDLCVLLATKVELPRVASARDVGPALQVVLNRNKRSITVPAEDGPLDRWLGLHFYRVTMALILVSRGRMVLEYEHVRYPRYVTFWAVNGFFGFLGVTVGLVALVLSRVLDGPLIGVCVVSVLALFLLAFVFPGWWARRREQIRFVGPWQTFGELAVEVVKRMGIPGP